MASRGGRWVSLRRRRRTWVTWGGPRGWPGRSRTGTSRGGRGPARRGGRGGGGGRGGAGGPAGDRERAEALARAIPDDGQRVRALASLAEVAAEGGDLDRAEVLARAIP